MTTKHDLILHAQANSLGGEVDGCPKCEEAREARKFDVLDDVMRMMAPRRGAGISGFGTVPWKVDLDLLREFLVRAACPIVCSGVNNGQENWHELCQNKADAAMVALGWAQPEAS